MRCIREPSNKKGSFCKTNVAYHPFPSLGIDGVYNNVKELILFLDTANKEECNDKIYNIVIDFITIILTPFKDLL